MHRASFSPLAAQSGLLEPMALGVDDIQKTLVDSGYYTADQLK